MAYTIKDNSNDAQRLNAPANIQIYSNVQVPLQIYVYYTYAKQKSTKHINIVGDRA